MPVELPNVLGVVLALTASACFAGQYLCVRLGTDRGNVMDIVLLTLLTNVAIVVPLTFAIHGTPSFSPQAVLWFCLAGLSGSLLARLSMFKSVQVIGASRTAPVVAANVFFATMLAMLLFDERLTLWHAIGIVLIVVGVAVVSWEAAQDDPDRSLRELGVSLLLPLVAALFLGFEPIFVTLGLETGTPVLPGFVLMASAATAGFLGYRLLFDRIDPGLFGWSPEMKWYLGAGVASTLGIISLFSGLAVAPVVIVVPLLQTSPLLVLILSAAFLPARLERVTWPLVLAALVVVLGAAIVSVQ